MARTPPSAATGTRFAGRARSRARRAAGTVVGAALLWWVLAGPEALLEPLALLAMLLAGLASLLLPAGRPLPLRPRAIPGLLGFFLRNSFVGGWMLPVGPCTRVCRSNRPLSPTAVIWPTAHR